MRMHEGSHVGLRCGRLSSGRLWFHSKWVEVVSERLLPVVVEVRSRNRQRICRLV
jgi:hypothetical protein